MEQTDPFIQVTHCRICKGSNLTPYLDLGHIPLVNTYVPATDAAKKDPVFPLQILFCNDCALSQLSIVVRPEILYSQYFYRSSISKTFTEHCFAFAKQAVNTFNLNAKDLVVDIASNDGCALNEFRKFSVRVVGVEPATNLAELAHKQGIPTINMFWNEGVARKIQTEYGATRLITAMNVFAHVHDLDAFLAAAKSLLADDGVLALEVPYLLNFVNKNEFDTSYHEHLSYFLVKPLMHLFERHDMEIADIKKFTIHGGTIRVYVKHKNNTHVRTDPDAIRWLLELEKDLGLYDIKTYLHFSQDVQKIRQDLVELLQRLRQQGKVIAAYGASAKGTVLMNYCGITKEMVQYVVDDTPEKQGLLTPGTHIPIVPASMLQTQKPDYLLLLAWNFADELMEKTQEYKDAGGRYIIPIPNVQII